MAESVELKKEWIEKLRHMLGVDEHRSKRLWGYRNHYCATIGGRDYSELVAMEQVGLVEYGRTINLDEDQYFHATLKGCKAIGLKPAAIKRAMRS